MSLVSDKNEDKETTRKFQTEFELKVEKNKAFQESFQSKNYFHTKSYPIYKEFSSCLINYYDEIEVLF